MDILLSKKAQKVFPFAVECKNQQKLNIWKAIEQAEKNAKDLIPIVVFKKNYEKPYVVLEWKTFLKILKGNKNAKD